jgi:large subunit ribosomal protein L37Ae
MATKKVGMTGKYGPRYGTKTKKVILQIEGTKSKTCPFCERESLKRVAAGIWQCKKCNAKFAGGAYTPRSV